MRILLKFYFNCIFFKYFIFIYGNKNNNNKPNFNIFK